MSNSDLLHTIRSAFFHVRMLSNHRGSHSSSLPCSVFRWMKLFCKRARERFQGYGREMANFRLLTDSWKPLHELTSHSWTRTGSIHGLDWTGSAKMDPCPTLLCRPVSVLRQSFIRGLVASRSATFFVVLFQFISEYPVPMRFSPCSTGPRNEINLRTRRQLPDVLSRLVVSGRIYFRCKQRRHGAKPAVTSLSQPCADRRYRRHVFRLSLGGLVGSVPIAQKHDVTGRNRK